MKIARLDTLTRQDNLFVGGEPDERYERRQMIVVTDNYDFISNNATDITSINNLTLLYGFGTIDYITYKDSLTSLYGNLTYNNLSDDEKKILCKNFITNKANRDLFYTDDEQLSFALDIQKKIKDLDIETNLLNKANYVINDIDSPLVAELSNYKEMFYPFDGLSNGVWHKITLNNVSPNSVIIVSVYCSKNTRDGGVREVDSTLDRKRSIKSDSSFSIPVRVNKNNQIEVYRQNTDITFNITAQLS